MVVSKLCDFLQYGIQLKQMPRTGWLQRGVPSAENVAAHSYGVILAAMMMVEIIDHPFDLARVLAMATLHDLPEALTSDIPSPVKRFFGRPTIKTEIERGALEEMTENVPFGARWRDLWEEYVAEVSAESRLVHDADKIDLYLQALTYEAQTNNQQLATFWHKPATFHFVEAHAIYDELRERRQNLR